MHGDVTFFDFMVEAFQRLFEILVLSTLPGLFEALPYVFDALRR